jgi:hypothetical protein
MGTVLLTAVIRAQLKTDSWPKERRDPGEATRWGFPASEKGEAGHPFAPGSGWLACGAVYPKGIPSGRCKGA